MLLLPKLKFFKTLDLDLKLNKTGEQLGRNQIVISIKSTQMRVYRKIIPGD